MTVTPSIMDIEDDHKPRYMVFSLMEKIIRDMQHSETGIPVRCQKIFLTTIPCAFTGYDLIEWLMEHLNIEEGGEALHLASLICQYGYFFPVTDTKNLLVKDDGTLYRFQSPYFWPSQNWEPDNVDYAIYLAKRSMRNKQRHGLEEHEQASFNKLQKMLCDKWDFIYMQAEEQVRLAKERKKADKVVLDSQERAFWRVHRPGPGQVKCLEEGARRNFRLIQMSQKKQKNAEGYKKEIAYLKRCILQARMKTSKAVESLMHRAEQFYEHEPFLVPPQPSNPWVSDDTTMWMLNTVLVETPTEKRVKRWAFGLQEVLADPTGRLEFEQFLQKEFSSENLHFWECCEELKRLPLSKVEDKVNEIYREYLSPGAPCEINIDSKTMETVINEMKKPSRVTFDAAVEHIYLLMKKDSYARFIRSDHYKNLLANAINPTHKKKFFNFGGTKKKSPAPSPKPKRRGSAASGEMRTDDQKMTGGSLSHHSFSTGNLHELDVDKSNKTSPFGSTGDLKAGNSGGKGFSPTSLRRKLHDLVKPDSPQRNLEVPENYPVHSPEENSEDPNISVNITVPNTNAKSNVVAPWENEESSGSVKTNNVVAPWEDENVVAPWENENVVAPWENAVAPWEEAK